MSKKKIEPTDAMVDWAANILCLDATHASLRFHAGLAQRTYRNKARAVMRTALLLALNHPDARGLFADEDTIRAAREQAWDEAAGWVWGREAWTDAEFRAANPYRPVPELPTEDGAVIVPADGHEYIETQTGKKSRRLTWDAECLVWYDARGTHLHGDITPGTWKVEGE